MKTRPWPRQQCRDGGRVIAAAAERTRGGDDRILQRRRRLAALIPRLKRGRVLCVG
jgi:hypothetical protein